MKIHEVAWPPSRRDGVVRFLGYAIEVVRRTKVEFPQDKPDPIDAAESYIRGQRSHQEYRAAADPWWDFVEANGLLTDFESGPAVTARLALTLLCVDEVYRHELGEHLERFFDLLERGGFDTREFLELLEDFFEPR